MTTVKCTTCDQMKKENKELRKGRDDIHKNYVEVVNENLSLRRKIEELEHWNRV